MRGTPGSTSSLNSLAFSQAHAPRPNLELLVEHNIVAGFALNQRCREFCLQLLRDGNEISHRWCNMARPPTVSRSSGCSCPTGKALCPMESQVEPTVQSHGQPSPLSHLPPLWPRSLPHVDGGGCNVFCFQGFGTGGAPRPSTSNIEVVQLEHRILVHRGLHGFQRSTASFSF